MPNRFSHSGLRGAGLVVEHSLLVSDHEEKLGLRGSPHPSFVKSFRTCHVPVYSLRAGYEA